MPPNPPPPTFVAEDADELSTEDESGGASSTKDEDDNGLDARPTRKRQKRTHSHGAGSSADRPASGWQRRSDVEAGGGDGGAATPVREQQWRQQLRSLERAVSPPVKKVGSGMVSEAETEDETEDEDEDDGKPLRNAVRKVEEAGYTAKEKQQQQQQQQQKTPKMVEKAASTSTAAAVYEENDGEQRPPNTTFLPSPIQLTRIRDLPRAANKDTVTLSDILCDPLIVEMWQFNYLFDMDFLMGALDEDVRNSVRVKVVHGSWKREDRQKQLMDAWAEAYPNLEVIQAYMPEAFGTHHSKMMVLIRADDYAQVIIHTANMIGKDWTNMTNAVWQSPLLPRLSTSAQSSSSVVGVERADSGKHTVGSGERFKVDLLRYLDAYGKRLRALAEQLVRYDFSAVRAAFVASTPTRVKLDDTHPDTRTSWGWVGLREVLRQISPCTSANKASQDNLLVAQLSSIATLDQTGAWLEHFQRVLGTRQATIAAAPPPSISSTSKPVSRRRTPFKPASSLLTPPSSSSSTYSPASTPPPPLRIIFPTVADIRTSLDGYYAGASIHLKTQSATQQKQFTYMRPKFCRWNTAKTTNTSSILSADSEPAKRALRNLAAPHIKTYVRYAYPKDSQLGGAEARIEWAMLTSANLSTQAWGALPSVGGGGGGSGGKGARQAKGQAGPGVDERGKEVRICSWEVGVVVWPELFAGSVEGSRDAVMVSVFGRDRPDVEDMVGSEREEVCGDAGRERIVVGWRMPYDLPLTSYGREDEPWCATARYAEPDIKGCAWDGF